jgi:tagatose 1,6-diphosphate aldolase
MRSLSIGKIRNLQQSATSGGALAVFALDHRGNLRRALRPESPERVTPAEMTAFKLELVSALASTDSAVLLDPEVGAAQSIAAGSLPGRVGLLVAVEASGYTGDPQARQSRILPGWSGAKAKRMGANGVKLPVYYHPDAPTAPEIETLVGQVAVELTGLARTAFLQGEAAHRMQRVTALCDALARPWTNFYQADPVDEGWYARY